MGFTNFKPKLSSQTATARRCQYCNVFYKNIPTVTMRYFTVSPQCEILALFCLYTLSYITKTKTFHFKQQNIRKITFMFIEIDTSINLVRLVWISCGPGSSVVIATDYGLDRPGSNPGGDEIFRPSRPALEPSQPTVKWIPGLSRG